MLKAPGCQRACPADRTRDRPPRGLERHSPRASRTLTGDVRTGPVRPSFIPLACVTDERALSDDLEGAVDRTLGARSLADSAIRTAIRFDYQDCRTATPCQAERTFGTLSTQRLQAVQRLGSTSGIAKRRSARSDARTCTSTIDRQNGLPRRRGM